MPLPTPLSTRVVLSFTVRPTLISSRAKLDVRGGDTPESYDVDAHSAGQAGGREVEEETLEIANGRKDGRVQTGSERLVLTLRAYTTQVPRVW